MPVNPAVVGRTYRVTEPHRVTASEIRAFADVVGGRPPRPTAGPADDLVAPPTFAVVVAQRAEALFMRDPEAGVDFSRLVHGEESFVHHEPVVAGDELTAETCVKHVRSVGGSDIVTLETTIATVGGAPRTTATSVVVVRGEGVA